MLRCVLTYRLAAQQLIWLVSGSWQDYNVTSGALKYRSFLIRISKLFGVASLSCQLPLSNLIKRWSESIIKQG